MMQYTLDNQLADPNSNNEPVSNIVGTGVDITHSLCNTDWIEIPQQFNDDVSFNLD